MTIERDYKDLLETIISTARKAAEKSSRSNDPQSRALTFAYCDVLDAAIMQAKVLEIDLNELGLADFDPYAVLSGKNAA